MFLVANDYHGDRHEFLQITFRNTGAGMDQNTRAHIIEPFFTTKDPGAGTGLGLGLAFVYGTIKLHNGFITVESDPGKGSTFTVYLPAEHKKPRATVQTHPSTQENTRGTILIVDDQPYVCDICREILVDAGYAVVVCESGEQALGFYQAQYPSIAGVVVDLMMPGMNGIELFRHLKQINPQIRALLSSGYRLDNEAQKVLDEGMRGFIRKPFSVENLVTAVTNVVQLEPGC